MENGIQKTDETEVLWQPENFYCPHPEVHSAVILLNNGISEDNVKSVLQWWCNASIRICVDGATNHFHHLMWQQQQGATACHCPCPLPDVISGDFDSIQPDLLKLYSAEGVTIVPTPDQNETDFTKAVRVAANLIEERQTHVNHILVVAGSNNNRFDHVLAILATLYKAYQITSTPVVVVWGGSLFWVLGAGRHRIQVSAELCRNPSSSWCGLVPVGQAATATTTGLKWNLDHQTLAFGQLVSTSNTYQLPPAGGNVTVTTSDPLLWTMGWMAEPGPFKRKYSELQNGF